MTQGLRRKELYSTNYNPSIYILYFFRSEGRFIMFQVYTYIHRIKYISWFIYVYLVLYILYTLGFRVYVWKMVYPISRSYIIIYINFKITIRGQQNSWLAKSSLYMWALNAFYILHVYICMAFKCINSKRININYFEATII